jgi:prolyl oligopeptidase
MPELMTPTPHSQVEPVTEILHGVPVTDPYRWLEYQDSPQTRTWIAEQTRYARAYLGSIAGRDRISQRIREFLAVETYDSVLSAANCYFFRKRLPEQEQPSICMREGPDGEDQVLLDPAERRTGSHTAVRPLFISVDGRLLLYEIKQGGERTGIFELFDVKNRRTLPDELPRGYLRGFGFAPDGRSFYYVHEALGSTRPFYRAAYQHVLGTSLEEDQEIFCAGEDEKLRLGLVTDKMHLGFLVFRFHDKIYRDFYIKKFTDSEAPLAVITGKTFLFAPLLLNDRILAITDLDAPNYRIVRVHPSGDADAQFEDIVPVGALPIQRWVCAGNYLFVSYLRGTSTEILVHDLDGRQLDTLPVREEETHRFVSGSRDLDEVLFETESFGEPIRIFRYKPSVRSCTLWAKKEIPFDSTKYKSKRVWYASPDGTSIPMFLFGRKDVVEAGSHPTIMTSYGGYGVPMTPQFSVFVAYLVERGCLFALPNIRGGSEFGAEWQAAARRQKRQTAFDDFLAGAEWLIETGRAHPYRLGIFGGSNSGLLVGAALTQRPDLFRAVVCMVPLLDMLRYHLFDNAHVWKEEFGTADDLHDFNVLARYSPYHQVREGVSYPAVMLVSGDADGNCNPLHARKMTARLQAASVSTYPILLDYSTFRGHSPVLPLTERINALTDRIAFVCDQLGIPE